MNRKTTAYTRSRAQGTTRPLSDGITMSKEIKLPPLVPGTQEQNDLWDHVYEYTHTSEGVHERLEKVCKAYTIQAIEADRAERQGEAVAWHNPVATAVRDGMTGQVQLEYIGHFPADELVRLYVAPQPHYIDLVNIAVAVRDACHKAWVTSAENWRADVDVRQIVRDTHPAPAPAQAAEPVAWMFPSENGYDDSAFRDHRTVVACTGNPWTGWIPLYTQPAQPPLTQPEKQRLWNDAMHNNRSSTTDAAMEYGRAIELAHGIGGEK